MIKIIERDKIIRKHNELGFDKPLHCVICFSDLCLKKAILTD